MWELDCEESRLLKNWCFWTVMLEKTLESPLDCKEIQPVRSKGDLSWVFFGRNDAKAETPVLWPPHAKSWLIGIDSDAGRYWGQEKGTTEDEMAGWHHRLDGREFEWTPGIGDGQGGLACWNSWGHKESDTNERLNWTDIYFLLRGSHFHSIYLREKGNLIYRCLLKQTNKKTNQKNTTHLKQHINSSREKIVKVNNVFSKSMIFILSKIVLKVYHVQTEEVIYASLPLCRLHSRAKKNRK